MGILSIIYTKGFEYLTDKLISIQGIVTVPTLISTFLFLGRVTVLWLLIILEMTTVHERIHVLLTQGWWPSYGLLLSYRVKCGRKKDLSRVGDCPKGGYRPKDGHRPKDSYCTLERYHTKWILLTSSIIDMDTFLQAFYYLKQTGTSE